MYSSQPALVDGVIHYEKVKQEVQSFHVCVFQKFAYTCLCYNEHFVNWPASPVIRRGAFHGE